MQESLLASPVEQSDHGAGRLPGNPAIWVFVIGDLFAFLMYFVVFMVYRYRSPSVFLDSQHHVTLLAGLVNTLVLLTGSRFVARAVVATRTGHFHRAKRFLAGAAGCGVVFVAVKAYEWARLISGGYTLARNDFFMFYFTLTGVHLFHVLLGLVVLGVCAFELRRSPAPRATVVEAGAIYWHMVDLLWIVLFALLYLMR